MKGILKELSKQLELKLFIASLLRQVFPKWLLPPYVIHGLLGLTKYQIHVLTEREKMTKDLWFKVMKYYGWRCNCCLVRNFYNEFSYIEKMEVDHIIPVSRWGYTTWNNMQVLCHKCNRSKGTGPRCKLHA